MTRVTLPASFAFGLGGFVGFAQWLQEIPISDREWVSLNVIEFKNDKDAIICKLKFGL